MALGGASVLIIEDEPLIALVLEDMVESLGGTVIAHASNLEEAKSLAQSVDVDLAVLDINLQGEMSYAAGALLAERNIPFFFATGYAHLERPPNLRHVPVINKPYTRHTLATVIRSVFDPTAPPAR